MEVYVFVYKKDVSYELKINTNSTNKSETGIHHQKIRDDIVRTEISCTRISISETLRVDRKIFHAKSKVQSSKYKPSLIIFGFLSSFFSLFIDMKSLVFSGFMVLERLYVCLV